MLLLRLSPNNLRFHNWPKLSAEPTSLQTHLIQSTLLGWFVENQRDFPWRITRDPYAILIAEKLLQQTAARQAVVLAYKDLIGAYPTPQDLAKARHADLFEVIKPLGFHFRARELITLAATILEQFDGAVPHTLRELKSLPGVGEYTARAVLSFAFDEDFAIVDTNVARWLCRVLGVERPLPSNPARDRQLLLVASALLPPGHSRDFNFAVLDLCSQVCLAKRPLCRSCPLQEICAYSSNSEPS